VTEAHLELMNGPLEGVNLITTTCEIAAAAAQSFHSE